MNGACDVSGCTGETYMGWAPRGEQKGKQICEYHFRRHDDLEDSFNLFDVFGFRRPAGIRKSDFKKDVPRCARGRERQRQHYARRPKCVGRT